MFIPENIITLAVATWFDIEAGNCGNSMRTSARMVPTSESRQNPDSACHVRPRVESAWGSPTTALLASHPVTCL